MAFSPALRRHVVVPIAAGALTAGILFHPRRTAYAEAPEAASSNSPVKKPIYDNPNPPPDPPNTTLPSTPADDTSDTAPAKDPTPTDLLAGYIRVARLQLHHYTSAAETSLDAGLTRLLKLESSLASTIAGLAPPPSANEPLLPGVVYVLVAAMAGSIITRNRTIVLRLGLPLGFAFAAARGALPVTMRNVGDLVWEYEKRYPALADAHLRVRERAVTFWQTGKEHTKMTVGMAEDKVGEAREKVEEWVKKGR